MHLAEALHHSSGASLEPVVERREEEVEAEVVYDAERGQEQPPPGMRPGSLSDPGPPQQVAATVGYVAAGAPRFTPVVLVQDAAIDDKTVAWLLERSLAERQREEEEAEEAEVVKKLEDDMALKESRLLELLVKDRAEGVRVTRHTWAALSRVEQAAVLWFLARDKVTQRKEKWKKKRKKKLPRTSSHSSSGRARRRQRQWHACNAGFPGDVPLLAVFLPVVYRLVMLGIMAVLGQKDSYAVTCIAVACARLVLLIFSPRVELPSVVCRPRCPGIMVGINQKDFFALIVDNGSCMVKAGFTGYDTPRACSLWFAGIPVMFGIMAGMDQRGQLCCEMVVDIPFVPQKMIPMVQTILLKLEIPQVLYVSWSSMSLLCGSCKFSGAAVEKTFVLPQLQLVERSPPVVCNHSCPVVQTAENCGFSRSCSSSRSLSFLS